MTDTYEQNLEHWATWMTATNQATRTINARIGTLTRLSRQANILALTPYEIVEFLAAPHLSQITRSTYYGHISAWLKWLRAMRISLDDPLTMIPAPKRPKAGPRPCSDDDLSRMIATANRRRTRAYILLAAYAGLRVHEVAKIRGDDFTISETNSHRTGMLTITGKGNKTAMIPLHDTLITLTDTMPKIDYWFPSYTRPGDHVSGQQVSMVLTSIIRRANVHGVTPHSLRHWYGSTLVSQGVDIRVVQELMRHDWLTSTQIYTAVPAKMQQEAINRLPAMA